MKVPARLDGYLHTKWVRHFWAVKFDEDTARIVYPKIIPSLAELRAAREVARPPDPG